MTIEDYSQELVGGTRECRAGNIPSRWNQKGLPQRGWSEVDEEDLGPAHETPEETPRATCGMCGHVGLRYVFFMEHAEYDGRLAVGRVCAGKMSQAYVIAPRKNDSPVTIPMTSLSLPGSYVS